MMGRLAALIGLALAVSAAGACRGGPVAPIDRQAFEDVLVELRKASREADSAAFTERRREILEAAGVTDSTLLAFVRAHAADLEYMADVWATVDRRVNAPQEMEADTVVR